MDKELLNTYLDKFQSIGTRIDDMSSILSVLINYCEAHPDNDEIYNISKLINMLRDNSKEISNDFSKLSDNVVSHFLI